MPPEPNPIMPLWASSRPETALGGNFVVRLQISLCGVLEYASAEILVFL